MFPHEGGQKHVVRDTKGHLNSKEKDGYRTESEKESCVQQDRQVTEEREKYRVRIGQKVRQAFTKENSSCYVFVNVKFNGVLKFAETVKIRGFDTF